MKISGRTVALIYDNEHPEYGDLAWGRVCCSKSPGEVKSRSSVSGNEQIMRSFERIYRSPLILKK